MADRIAELARRLQVFLRDSLGVNATIETRTEPATGPRIVVASDIWGDLYAGGSLYETLEVRDVTRPGTGEPLQVAFSSTQEQQAGIVEEWRAVIRGAQASEHEPLRELFHPRHWFGSWNVREHSATFEIDGVVREYEARW